MFPRRHKFSALVTVFCETPALAPNPEGLLPWVGQFFRCHEELPKTSRSITAVAFREFS